MNPVIYRQMFELELSHWWYQALDHLVLQTLKNLDLGTDATLLDAGCGTGRVLSLLGASHRVIGIDFSQDALEFCAQRKVEKLIRGSLEQIPIPDASIDTVLSLDVLYHQAITDDLVPLREFHRVLKPGGSLILHLPALDILRGHHDELVHTRERYSKAKLKDRLHQSGFKIEFISYRLFLLFPMILLTRTLQRFQSKVESDIFPLGPVLNRLLLWLLKLENFWLRRFSLPLGSSIFVVAKKC